MEKYDNNVNTTINTERPVIKTHTVDSLIVFGTTDKEMCKEGY